MKAIQVEDGIWLFRDHTIRREEKGRIAVQDKKGIVLRERFSSVKAAKNKILQLLGRKSNF